MQEKGGFFMKKSIALLVALLLITPAGVRAQGDQLKRKFNIVHIGQSEIAKNGNLFSTTAYLTMRDGKEFIITGAVDKKNLTASFSFASGKTVLLTLAGIEIKGGEGYQKYDDIENSTNFIETYVSETCLLNIIGYLIFPYPVNLIFLYYRVPLKIHIFEYSVTLVEF
jgi:hypothetical protein